MTSNGWELLIGSWRPRIFALGQLSRLGRAGQLGPPEDKLGQLGLHWFLRAGSWRQQVRGARGRRLPDFPRPEAGALAVLASAPQVVDYLDRGLAAFAFKLDLHPVPVLLQLKLGTVSALFDRATGVVVVAVLEVAEQPAVRVAGEELKQEAQPHVASLGSGWMSLNRLGERCAG